MPNYTFTCAGSCGDFTVTRRMDRSGEPADCPHCGGPARRTYAVPYIGVVSPLVRMAHDRNERSADSPRVVAGEDWSRRGAHHGHQHGTAHGESGPNLHRAHGPYPWAVGH